MDARAIIGIVKLEPRWRWGLTVAAISCAYALVVPELNSGGLPWNQGSSYALVRALADGTPKIDRYTWQSGDISYFRGHYYSVRAPGLALLEVPVYAALRAVGVAPEGSPVTATSRAQGALGMLWALGLVGAVLPGIAVVLLVRNAADRLVSGSGALCAAIVGLATLMLPFSSMLFVHAFSTMLGFAAFTLERKAFQKS